MSEWKPEIQVHHKLALSLIVAQFPNLQPLELIQIGTGWDNIVYRLNDKWFFRFPQRQVAVEGVQREIKCLSMLASRLSGIINPEFVGQPSPMYPWPFFGYQPILGSEAPDANLTLEQRNAMVRPVAVFLQQLHAKDIFEAIGPSVPVDPLGRMDFSKRIQKIRERFDRCQRKYGDRLPINISDVERIIRSVNHEVHLSPTALVHGDFHFRHLIISDKGKFSGVIDWGDMNRSNPVIDLQIAWSFFPADLRKVFWEEYGPVSEQQLAQSRALALFLSLSLFEYAIEENLEPVLRESICSFNFLLQD